MQEQIKDAGINKSLFLAPGVHGMGTLSTLRVGSNFEGSALGQRQRGAREPIPYDTFMLGAF